MGTDRPDDEELERRDHDYQWLSAAAGGLILIGTITMKLIEEWSWVDSFYFAVVTATTVGFGDLTPETTSGKLFTTLYIVVGVGLIGTYLNIAFKRRFNRSSQRSQRAS
jgi:voltage-gated potassium channel